MKSRSGQRGHFVKSCSKEAGPLVGVSIPGERVDEILVLRETGGVDSGVRIGTPPSSSSESALASSSSIIVVVSVTISGAGRDSSVVFKLSIISALAGDKR